MIELRRVESVAASPDGTWLAVAVQQLDDEAQSKYVGELWRVPLDGGEPTQLTRGAWNDRAPAFRHDGALLFLSNRPTGKDDDGHDKRSQVFAFGLHGEEPVCLTDEPLGVSAFQAARHADVLVVEAPMLPDVAFEEQRKTKKDRAEHGPTTLVYDDMPVRFWDHWLPAEIKHLVAYSAGARRDLTPNANLEVRRASWQLAPNGGFLLVHPSKPGEHRLLDEHVVLIDVERGEHRVVLDQPGMSYGAPLISPDSRRVAMTRHQRRAGEFGANEVVVAGIDGGATTVVRHDLDTGLTPTAWTADGSALVLTGPLRTHCPVFLADLDDHTMTRVTSLDAGGTHTSVSVVGDTVIGLRSTVLHPPEVFRCALEAEAEPQLLTNLSGFDGADFAVAEDHEVVSTDGTPVQFRIVRPAADAAPRACIMAIHGGPISDWGDVWHWRWNSLVLAAAGYVVALPNPRGSVGFGQAFVEGIWNNQWGGQCYEDLMAVADALEARPDVDADRVVAMGGSFGGYMTNWIGSQTDRFACLLTHASIFDITAFHGVTDLPAWWAFSFGVEPYVDRRAFDRYSPVEHVANWTSPTLVIHGDRDYRVPIGESLALFEALRAHDVTARLVVFPDENHWILRPNNILAWYDEVLSFIAMHTA